MEKPLSRYVIFCLINSAGKSSKPNQEFKSPAPTNQYTKSSILRPPFSNLLKYAKIPLESDKNHFRRYYISSPDSHFPECFFHVRHRIHTFPCIISIKNVPLSPRYMPHPPSHHLYDHPQDRSSGYCPPPVRAAPHDPARRHRGRLPGLCR